MSEQQPRIGLSRRALVASASVAVVGAGAAALSSVNQPTAPAATLRARRTLRLVTSWPRSFPGLGTSVERLANRIAATSEGALAVRIFAAGELAPANGVQAAVAEGKADLYHSAEYYWRDRHPGFSFFSSVPFGLTADEMNAWLHFGGGQALWDELSARFNIKPFACGNTGCQMGGWYKRPIRSLADFKGLRIRIPGLGGEVAARLGAAPVTLAGGDIQMALRDGQIDAAEWIGPWNDVAFGLHKAAKNYYGPGFQEPGSTLSLGMNLDLWRQLDPASRAIIAQAAEAENMLMQAEYNYRNAMALQTLETDFGIRAQPFPDDVLDAARAASGALLARIGSLDELTGRIYGSFFSARKLLDGWTRISEQAYLQARGTEA